MKQETRTGIDRIFLPGGIVVRALPIYQYKAISKKRKVLATGALVFNEGLRLAALTMPVWLPLVVESNVSADDKKYEFAANAAMGVGVYYLITRIMRFGINYVRQQESIQRLYPPKIHPRNEDRELQREPGDLEKRL